MSRDPNDDRSDSMNPNNDAYQANLDNHSNQLNPNNDEYRGNSNVYHSDREDYDYECYDEYDANNDYLRKISLSELQLGNVLVKIGDTVFFDTDVRNLGEITRIFYQQRIDVDGRGNFTGKNWSPSFVLENKDGFGGVLSGCTSWTEEAVNCRAAFNVMPAKCPLWRKGPFSR